MALQDVQTSIVERHDAASYDTITKIQLIPSPSGGVSVICTWGTPKRQGRRGNLDVSHGTIDFGDLSTFYRWLATKKFAGVKQ